MTKASDPAQPKAGPTLKAIPLEEARRARGQNLVALPRSKVASLRAFRRIRADRIFGGVGILLLLVGTTLAFTWPPPPPPIDYKYDVEWPGTVWAVETTTRTLSPNENFTHTFNVDRTNVTHVRWWIYFKDDVGDERIEADTMRITVLGPAGSNVSFSYDQWGDFTGSNHSRMLPMSGLPNVTTVPARTEAQAWAALGDHSNRTGQGAWKIAVHLVDARHDYSNVPNRTIPCAPPYCVQDPGNAYTIHFEYGTYQAAVSKGF